MSIPIQFSLEHRDKFCVISFELVDSIEPSILKDLNPPDPIKEKFNDKGVVLSGRGPIWLYAFLTHVYHPTKFIATYDPRLGGAVIVESHNRDYSVGTVIPLEIH